MCYDLSVWRGAAPLDDAAASAEFERRMDEAQESSAPASEEIILFVRELEGSISRTRTVMHSLGFFGVGGMPSATSFIPQHQIQQG